MKYLFLSLLLLNILYALWQLQVRVPATVEEVEVTEPVMADARRRTAPAVAIGSAPEPRQVPDSALCVSLGRFNSAEEAEQLRQRLLVLGVVAEVKSSEVVVGTDYWLVMPVMGGERHAVLQLSALQEQGVDSFLITRGELAGQLSMGVFAREDYARLRREQLLDMGHEVDVHTLSKTEQQFAVEVGSQSRRLIDQAMLSRLREDFPFMQHQYQPCTGVANGRQIP